MKTNLAISALKFAINLIENGLPTTTYPKIGTVMPDGMIYAGISPDTQGPFYVEAEDAPVQMKWDEAMKYAESKKLSLFTKAEAAALFLYREAIGGFKTDDWYWTSTEYLNVSACYQTFSTGSQSSNAKSSAYYVRCVRR